MAEPNKCLYWLKQFFNLLLILSGILLIAIGAYIWSATKQFSFVEITFIAIGALQVLLGLFVLGSKKAKFRISIYNFMLAFLFLLVLICLILGFALKDELIRKAAEYQQEAGQSIEELEKLINKNVSTALYVTISVLVVQLFALTFSVWYRDSLSKLDDDNLNLLYDEKQKKYITIDDYQRQQQADAKQRTDQKRNDLYSQNPEFLEYKMRKEAEEQKAQQQKKKKQKS
ncbi:hypothetical protein pb186bvf_013943 [Paramecium bursaria]